MRLDVKVGERAGQLRLVRDGSNCWFELLWDGEGEPAERTASVVEVEPGVYSVVLDGRSYEARVSPSGRGWGVDVGPSHFEVEAADPRSSRGRARTFAGDERLELKAPMPGKVVRVLVEPGGTVEAGQGLVVVEAMKMQNEMKSPRPGVVAAVRVQEGATVNAGDVLVVVE
ncbi:MAG: biotin/lipoyl-containing protein [Bryobacteraceae bacterium]